MLQVYTVSFFGHRRLEGSLDIDRKLETLVRDLLYSHEYLEFLVGRDGDYDLLVASVIHRCKRQYRADNSSLVWVLPYLTADYRDNEESYRSYYDEIEVFSGSHYKAAFQERNRAMIDRCDLAVFAVNKPKGSAYSTMKYAAANGINCINIYDRGKYR